MAARDRNLEFAWQIVELGISAKLARQFERDGRRVANFIGIEPRQRAAGDVAHHIAAGSRGRQPHGMETVENFWQRFDRHPMQLNILPNSYIRHAARVTLSDIRNGADLRAAQYAVGNPDPHHKVGRRFSFSTGAANHAIAVALCVNPPRAKIRPQPLRRYRAVALPCEPTETRRDISQAFLARFSRSTRCALVSLTSVIVLSPKNKKPTNQVVWRWALET